MTVFLSFRTQPVGGSVAGAQALAGDGTAETPTLQKLQPWDVARLVEGKDILFAVHGFNVNYVNGARSLGRLDQFFHGQGALGHLDADLQFKDSELFIGVLWPGDSWIPGINYPFEGSTAIKTGDLLADFCNKQLKAARSLSFLSHSLGARVVLQAVEEIARTVPAMCLTAGAINYDCLTAQYEPAADNATGTDTLASRRDLILKLAYPIGDPIADLLTPDHQPFTSALGYRGPRRPVPGTVTPSQIPDLSDYDHGDYFPPSSVAPPASDLPWVKVAQYAARAFRGQHQVWP